MDPDDHEDEPEERQEEVKVDGAISDLPSAPPPSSASYGGLADEIRTMEPHLAIRPDLENLRIGNDDGAEASPSAPVEPLQQPSEDDDDCGGGFIQPYTERQILGLYSNAQLEDNEAFVRRFLAEQEAVAKSELHELLTNYLRVRVSLVGTEKALDALRADVEAHKEAMWTMRAEKAEESGECQDEKEVSAVVEYQVAEFNPGASASLASAFKEMKETLVENFSLHSYKSEVCRLKIEDFVYRVVARADPAAVKSAVNVLFFFQRKLISDAAFFGDVRRWMGQLVAVILRDATLADHLFLLNHVMRSPAGVGEWGAHFVQPQPPNLDPEEPGSVAHSFNNPYVDNILTMLSTVLLKVEGREELLKELKVVQPPPIKSDNVASSEEHLSDAIFTVLDSEGEEDVEPWTSWSLLRENDLVQILTQIPLDDMFRYILRVERRDGRDDYDPARSSEHSFLRLFAFSTRFVYLLREGLSTFNTPRFRQFAKRLGQMIMHTVEYVSDHWAAFKASASSLDPALHRRIQIEYDHFFLRATKCIFSSQKLGAWQYLAAIPYSTISLEMLWRIFYVLHLDYTEEHHGDFGENITGA